MCISHWQPQSKLAMLTAPIKRKVRNGTLENSMLYRTKLRLYTSSRQNDAVVAAKWPNELNLD